MSQQKQQQPSVGRIVHVYRSGGWGRDNEPRAAIVTGVNQDGTVDGFLHLRPRDLDSVAVPSAFLKDVPVVVNKQPGVPFSGPEFRSSIEGYWAEWPPHVPMVLCAEVSESDAAALRKEAEAMRKGTLGGIVAGTVEHKAATTLEQERDQRDQDSDANGHGASDDADDNDD